VEARATAELGAKVGAEAAAAAELRPLWALGTPRPLAPSGPSGAHGHAWLLCSLIEAWRTEPRPEPPAAVMPVRMPAPVLVEFVAVCLSLVHLSLL